MREYDWGNEGIYWGFEIGRMEKKIETAIFITNTFLVASFHIQAPAVLYGHLVSLGSVEPRAPG